MIRDWPGLILRYGAAREWGGRLCSRVFVLGGPHDSRITIVAQQVRAINLAWALYRTARLCAPDRTPATVGVVGAGAGGATFAAAAALLGGSVTLFDEHEEPISTQRWSFDRYLHPNLFDWPVEGWDDPRANLPVLDWSAGPSAKVRLEMLKEFSLAAAHGGVKWCSQHSVSEVCPDGDDVKLTICDLRSAAEPDAANAVRVAVVPFEVVVVATGFLPESKVAHTVVSGSYWHDVDLERVLGSATSDHTIVGDGDGALTELLRLSLDGREKLGSFHQSMLTTIAQRLLDLDAVAADVLAVESGISGGRAGNTLREFGGDRFARVDDELENWLREGQHRTEVRAGRVTSLRTSFALNRFLAARLVTLGAARFLLGEPFDAEDVPALAPSSVVWRTGCRPRRCTVLIRPAFTVNDPGDALADDPARQDVLGTVDDLMDASREPRWDDRANAELSGRAHGSALKAAADIEAEGLDASRALPWRPSVWPAFVDSPPLLMLSTVIFDLAHLAVSIDNSPPPTLWSNFIVTREDVDLSLDLVAAAANLTPTEVVDQLRRRPESGISLALVWVERGVQQLDRVWIRVERSALAARQPPGPDWTSVSLLLAPGFAEGDSRHEDDLVTFEWHAAPRTGTEAFDELVGRVLEERALAMALPIRASPTEQRVRRDAIADGVRHDGGASERAYLTVLHRRLAGDDDFEFRSALVGLAVLAEAHHAHSSLTSDYLARVLGLPQRDRGAALRRAAFGPLVRRDPATGDLIPLTLHAERLQREIPEHVASDEPDHDDVGAPDLSAFAVYIQMSQKECR